MTTTAWAISWLRSGAFRSRTAVHTEDNARSCATRAQRYTISTAMQLVYTSTWYC